MFGESAWTFNHDRQQYYYHAYSEDEPDLNLTNPAVIAELDVSLLLLILSMVHVAYLADKPLQVFVVLRIFWKYFVTIFVEH